MVKKRTIFIKIIYFQKIIFLAKECSELCLTERFKSKICLLNENKHFYYQDTTKKHRKNDLLLTNAKPESLIVYTNCFYECFKLETFTDYYEMLYYF